MAKNMTIEEKIRELDLKRAELFVIEDLCDRLKSDLWWRCEKPTEGETINEEDCVYRVFDEDEGHYRYITKDSCYANDAIARLDIMEKLVAMV